MNKYEKWFLKDFLTWIITFGILIIIFEILVSMFLSDSLYGTIEQERKIELSKSWHSFEKQIKKQHLSFIKGYAWWNEAAMAFQKNDREKIKNLYEGDPSLYNDYDVFLAVDSDLSIIYGAVDGIRSNIKPENFERARNKEYEQKFYDYTKTVVNDILKENNWKLESIIKQNQNIDEPYIKHFIINYNNELRFLTLSPICTNNGYPYTEGFILIGEKIDKIISRAEELIPAKIIITPIQQSSAYLSFKIRNGNEDNFNWINFTPNLQIKQISGKSLTIFILVQVIVTIVLFALVYPFASRKNNKKLIKIIDEQTDELNHKNHLLEMEVDERIKKEERLREYSEELAYTKDLVEQHAFELIQLNIKLEDSQKRLEELNSSKDKFFTIIAHDLRSPFITLFGMITILREEFDQLSQNEIIGKIDMLSEASNNLYRLVNNLLSWSAAQTGRIEYKPQKFNLNNVIREIVSVYNDTAKNKQIVIICDDTENIELYADADMIAASIRNLVANAIKYTPVNGTIQIIIQSNDGRVLVKIKDTGVGIKKSDINKLFRIDILHKTPGTNNEKGTGLGLILTKEFITKNGGELTVVSEPGEGSEFIINLPAQE